MPTYDYKCLSCGHKFSAFLPISKKDEAKCPACESIETEQRYTGFFFARPSGAGQGATTGSCSSSSCGGCAGCG